MSPISFMMNFAVNINKFLLKLNIIFLNSPEKEEAFLFSPPHDGFFDCRLTTTITSFQSRLGNNLLMVWSNK